MQNRTVLCLALLAAVTVATAPGVVSAQSQNWAVFRNCNSRPCTIGVAVSTWYVNGWSRLTTYQNQVLAWRRACYLHYYDSGHYSPDIASGSINCSAM
jgi:hypothetical protein